MGLLFLLVASLSLVQTPVKTSQLTYERADYTTAAWLAADAEAHGVDLPASYVFSRWDHTRMYNYFVNGEARSYAFARNNYRSFLSSTDSGDWYDRLAERVGYVVVEQDPRDGEAPPGSMYARLSTPTTAPSHYRAIYRSPTGKTSSTGSSRARRSSGTGRTVDPSTCRRGCGSPGPRLWIRERSGRAAAVGIPSPPYPGTYQVANRTAVVNESAVRTGATVRPGPKPTG